MKRINYLLLAIITLNFTLTSCEKDTVDLTGEFENGIFVVNEGNWGQGNASLSFTDKELSTVKNDVFSSVNQLSLGDVGQSIGFANDNAYIVVNASNKIEVANRNTMEYVVTIASGLTNPRYFEALDDYNALVTCWGDPFSETDDYLAIVNLSSNVVTGTIPVDLGPEKMVQNDDYLFVAHQGAYGTNNIITVYDKILDKVTGTITVGDVPNSMYLKDDYLFVLCGGKVVYDPVTYEITEQTPGQLDKIDLNSLSVVETLTFANESDHPKFLTGDEDQLFYFLNGNIYKMNTTDSQLPTATFFSYANVYNMEAYDGKIYLTDPKDYVSEGEIVMFNTTDGQEEGRKTVGIIPGDIGFNFE